MLVVIGLLIVVVGTLLGFIINGGSPRGLFHTGELVPILGMFLGCLVIASPWKVIKGIGSGMLRVLRGAPYRKADYQELMQCLYELFLLGRRGGLIALEEHVVDPHGSSIFSKYPRFHANHRALELLCDGLRPLVDGRIKPDQLGPLMQRSLDTLKEEEDGPLLVLNRVADAMPAFGIVACVLGIVITMTRIDQGATAVGEGMASALCGTFYGIFLAYGVISPLATNLEFNSRSGMQYMQVIRAATLSFANGMTPLVACEVGRRVLPDEVRPSSTDLEELLKSMR